MLWLYLYFPRLQLDLLKAASPCQAQPQVLLDAKSHRVKQADALASAKGIHSGMSLAQACALAADLQVRSWQAALEQQQLQHIADALYQYCADLALAPPTALWLRLDPMLALYKSLPVLLEQLFAVLQLYALDYRAGIAPTAQAARLCALTSPSLQLTEPVQLPVALQQISIQLLPLEPKVLAQFSRLGITTIGQWLALAPAALSRRLPVEVQRLREEILGQRPATLSMWQPAAVFQQRLELYWHTELVQQLEKPLHLLLRQLQQFLQRSNQRCFQTELILEVQDQAALQLVLHSPQALGQASQWLRLWQQKLSPLALPAPVVAIRLRADQLTTQAQQTAALDSENPSQSEPLLLLGLLQARLGELKVRQPQPPTGWQATCEAIPTTPFLTADKSAAAALLPALLQSAVHTPRPVFIYDTPQACPLNIHWQPGLERLHSQWWQAPSPATELRIGLSPEGRWLWVSRQQHSAWQLLGVFA